MLFILILEEIMLVTVETVHQNAGSGDLLCEPRDWPIS